MATYLHDLNCFAILLRLTSTTNRIELHVKNRGWDILCTRMNFAGTGKIFVTRQSGNGPAKQLGARYIFHVETVVAITQSAGCSSVILSYKGLRAAIFVLTMKNIFGPCQREEMIHTWWTFRQCVIKIYGAHQYLRWNENKTVARLFRCKKASGYWTADSKIQFLKFELNIF